MQFIKTTSGTVIIADKIEALDIDSEKEGGACDLYANMVSGDTLLLASTDSPKVTEAVLADLKEIMQAGRSTTIDMSAVVSRISSTVRSTPCLHQTPVTALGKLSPN